MTIGIYSITNVVNGKRYIGKSIDIERRFDSHRYWLTSDTRSATHTNRYLFAAVKKYGIDNFQFEILESFNDIDECKLKDRELYWMDHFRTCDRAHGYNLRRDSSSQSWVHPDTRRLQSINMLGQWNPNYGNNWSDEQKSSMSSKAQARHASGEFYGDEWKQKLGVASSRHWSVAERRARMGAKVSKALEKYAYEQRHIDGTLICTWDSVKQILEHNPDYKKQNIHSVADGHKKTYAGFVWRKVLKGQVVPGSEFNGYVVRREFGVSKKVVSERYSYEQRSLDGMLVKVWDGAKEAAATLGIKRTGIQGCANGHCPHYKGFVWRKVLKPSFKHAWTPKRDQKQ